ncbi:hypothetical protein ACPV5L_08435 [Vibrio astriarenae]
MTTKDRKSVLVDVNQLCILPENVQQQLQLIRAKLFLPTEATARLVILPAKACSAGGLLRSYIIGVAICHNTPHKYVCELSNLLGVHVIIGSQQNAKSRFTMENIGFVYDYRLKKEMVLQLAVVCSFAF